MDIQNETRLIDAVVLVCRAAYGALTRYSFGHAEDQKAEFDQLMKGETDAFTKQS